MYPGNHESTACIFLLIPLGGYQRIGGILWLAITERSMSQQINPRGKIQGHPLRHTYGSMHARCYNQNDRCYDRYGGRGIKVCERWSRGQSPAGQGFWNFVDDMGEKPANTTLDRVNNDGDYAPENCRWASPETQATNRDVARGARTNRTRLSEDDVRAIRKEYKDYSSTPALAKYYGVCRDTIYRIAKKKSQGHIRD
jgi:hypothetical protein